MKKLHNLQMKNWDTLKDFTATELCLHIKHTKDFLSFYERTREKLNLSPKHLDDLLDFYFLICFEFKIRPLTEKDYHVICQNPIIDSIIEKSFVEFIQLNESFPKNLIPLIILKTSHYPNAKEIEKTLIKVKKGLKEAYRG